MKKGYGPFFRRRTLKKGPYPFFRREAQHG
jgi:hypothetical protein